MGAGMKLSSPKTGGTTIGGPKKLKKTKSTDPSAHVCYLPAEEAKAIKTGGQPIRPDVKQSLEQQLGQDLSDVVVHTGTNAMRLTAALQAKAFSYGKDIFFQAGVYDPNYAASRELLAQEIAHVMQEQELDESTEGYTGEDAEM